MNTNNFLAVLVIFCLSLCLIFVAGNKLKSSIIQSLLKDYAPGPYAPGFDPDKLDPNLFRQQRQQQSYPPLQQQRDYNSEQPPYRSSYDISSMGNDNIEEEVYKVPYIEDTPEDWNKFWETQRY